MMSVAPLRNNIHNINNNVSSKCVGLSSAVVQMYKVNSESKWEEGCSGVVCLIKDNLRQSHYIRVFNVNNGTVTLDQEVNNDLDVYFPTHNFMVFVKGTNGVGLKFASENEACHFQEHWKLLRENRQKEAESNVPLKVRNFLKATCKTKKYKINSNSKVNSILKACTLSKKKKNGRWRIKRWKKAGTLVQHGGHIEWKLDQHFDFRNPDEKQMHILDECDSCTSHLKEVETMKEGINLSEKSNNVELVRHKLQNQTLSPLVEENTPPLTLTALKSSRSAAPRPPRLNRMCLPAPPPPPTFQISNTVTTPHSSIPHSPPPSEPAPTDFHLSADAAVGECGLPFPWFTQPIQNQTTKVNQVKNEKRLPPPPPLPDSSLLSSMVASKRESSPGIKRPQLTVIAEGYQIKTGAGAPALISKQSPPALIPSRISSGCGSHPPLTMNTLLHPSLIKKNVSLKEDHAISIPQSPSVLPSKGDAGLNPYANRSTLLSQIRGREQLKEEEKKGSTGEPTPSPGALHAYQPFSSGDGLPIKSCFFGSQTKQGTPEGTQGPLHTSCSHAADITPSNSSHPPSAHSPSIDDNVHLLSNRSTFVCLHGHYNNSKKVQHGHNTEEPPSKTSLQHSNPALPMAVTVGDNSDRKRWLVFSQNSKNTCQKTCHPRDQIDTCPPLPELKPVHSGVSSLYSVGSNSSPSFRSRSNLLNQIRQDTELRIEKNQRKSNDAAPPALREQPPTLHSFSPFRPPNKDVARAQLKLHSNGASTISPTDDRPSATAVSGGDSSPPQGNKSRSIIRTINDIQKIHNSGKPTLERSTASPPAVPSLSIAPSKENDCKPSSKSKSVFLTQVREASLLKENKQQQSNVTSPLDHGHNLDHGHPSATVSIMKSEGDERYPSKHLPTLVNQISLKEKEQEDGEDAIVTSTSGQLKFDPASSGCLSTRSIMMALMDVIKKRREVTQSSEEESDADEGW